LLRIYLILNLSNAFMVWLPSWRLPNSKP
jgi:hypothetical protein